MAADKASDLVAALSSQSIPSRLSSLRTRATREEPVVYTSSDIQVDNPSPPVVTCSKTFYRRIAFENKDMLRGTRVADVLKCFGQILKHSQGSAGSYELSTPVGQIDVFLSHNWSTPRWEKFLALALYFNSGKAFAAMCVCSLLTVPLTMHGMLPEVEVNLDSTEPRGNTFFSLRDSLTYSEPARVGVSAPLIGVLALLLVLVLGHEFQCCSGPVAFLDKTCIHQTDPELKQKGIESLAAFLAHSKAMVIVYSSNYLRKLWTVYELASMLLLHPDRQIIVIPTFLPKFFVGGLVLYTTFLILQRVTTLHGMLQITSKMPHGEILRMAFVVLVLTGVCYIGFCVHMSWERQRAEIKDVLKNFSIRNAKCSAEADRVPVQRSIATFIVEMQLISHVEDESEEALQERALTAFDNLVRREVPPALKASFGRQGVPYQYTLLVGASHMLRYVDLLPWYIHRKAYYNLVVTAVTYCTMWLCVIPLWLAVVSRIAAADARSVERRRWRKLEIFSKFAMVTAAGVGDWYALAGLSYGVQCGNSAAFVLFLLMVCANAFFSALAYRPMAVAKVERVCLRDVLSGSPPSPRGLEEGSDRRSTASQAAAATAAAAAAAAAMDKDLSQSPVEGLEEGLEDGTSIIDPEETIEI